MGDSREQNQKKHWEPPFVNSFTLTKASITVEAGIIFGIVAVNCDPLSLPKQPLAIPVSPIPLQTPHAVELGPTAQTQKEIHLTPEQKAMYDVVIPKLHDNIIATVNPAYLATHPNFRELIDKLDPKRLSDTEKATIVRPPLDPVIVPNANNGYAGLYDIYDRKNPDTLVMTVGYSDVQDIMFVFLDDNGIAPGEVQDHSIFTNDPTKPARQFFAGDIHLIRTAQVQNETIFDTVVMNNGRNGELTIQQQTGLHIFVFTHSQATPSVNAR